MLEMIPKGHPLEGVRLKLDRAEEHLEAFDREIAAFFEREPYAVSCERKPNGFEHVYTLHVSEHPPLSLGIPIGECLQSMRSALDHLVRQLALRSGKKTRPARQTAFPICDTIEAFRSKGSKNKVADLTKEYRASIERLQPFKVGGAARDHWLWHLNELARVDRHQILHVVGAVHESIGITVGERDDDDNFYVIPLGQLQPELRMTISSVPFEDGAEIARFALNPSNPDPEMEMDCEFSFLIAFGEGISLHPLYPVTDALNNILSHIETEVVSPFVDSFGIMT